MQLEVPVTSSGPAAYVKLAWPSGQRLTLHTQAQSLPTRRLRLSRSSSATAGHGTSECYYYGARGVQGVSVSFWPFSERAFESGSFGRSQSAFSG